MDTSLLITRSPSGIPLRLVSGAALAAVVAPVAGWGTDGTVSALITSVAAISIGVTLAIVVARLVPRPRLAWLGALLVAAAALLIAVTPRGVITAFHRRAGRRRRRAGDAAPGAAAGPLGRSPA